MALGDLRQRRQIDHLEPRIAHNLGEEQAGFRSDRLLEGGRIARVDEGRLDPEAGQSVGKEIEGAAVKRRGGDDVSSLAHQCGDRKEESGMAGGGSETGDPAVQRRYSLLEDRDRGIADPGVEIAGLLQVEERGSMIGILKDIGGRLIDGYGARTGHWIRLLACVQRESVELRKPGTGHRQLLPKWQGEANDEKPCVHPGLQPGSSALTQGWAAALRGLRA